MGSLYRSSNLKPNKEVKNDFEDNNKINDGHDNNNRIINDNNNDNNNICLYRVTPNITYKIINLYEPSFFLECLWSSLQHNRLEQYKVQN